MNIPSREVIKLLGITTAFVLLLLVAFFVRRELLWIGTAFFLAVALDPAVTWLSRWMPRKSRLAAVSLVFLLGVGMLVFLIAEFAPLLVTQSVQLGHHLPKYADDLVQGNSWASQQLRHLDLQYYIQTSQSQLGHYLASAGGSAYIIVRDVFSSFAAGFTVLGLVFFMLLEGHAWVNAVWRIVPDNKKAHAQNLAFQMYEAVTGYVTGNLLTSLLAVIAVAIMLTIVRVPFAIPLGILVGIFDLLPLVGATLGASLVILVALFTSVAAAVVMLIFFVIYQQLENHILQPLVYGRTVKMSPLTVLISVLIGAGLGGIIGAIVAIPVGASVQIVVRDYANRRRLERVKDQELGLGIYDD